VSDLIDGIARAGGADAGEINRTPTNLGNPMESTVRQLAEQVIALAGSTSGIEFVQRPPADPSRRRPDIARAERVLGWRPTVGLEEGLRSTIEWARAEPGA
jgi:nucleoside-diphosphate-sugar epimerase